MKRLDKLKTWRRKIVEQYAHPNGERVITFKDLFDVARSIKADLTSEKVSEFVDDFEGLLFRKAPNGLLVNVATFPPATLGEAVPHLIDQAIVSLHTVLGDKGILNNYTPDYVCVRPISLSPDVVALQFESGQIDCFPVDDKILLIGEVEDRLDPSYRYPRATPEAAIIHWFALGRVGAFSFSEPDTQVDLEDVDMDRLQRIAAEAGLGEVISDWVRRVRERNDYDDNERWRDEPLPSQP
jgi:hypothetical protein